MGPITRLFGHPPQPDGIAEVLATDAFAAGRALAARIGPATPTARAIAKPESVLHAALGAKLLHGWIQNRYQTRYPLALNLRNQSPAEARLLIEALAEALRASDPDATSRAAAWVQELGGAFDPAILTDPATLPTRLRGARLVPQAYAICAGGLGRRTLANRRYLDFLAARLGLPDDVARSLNRRYASQAVAPIKPLP